MDNNPSAIRMPVLGPGEEDPVNTELRSKVRHGLEARLPLNGTLFRLAERYYKSRAPAPSYETLIDSSFSDDALSFLFPHLLIDYLPITDVINSIPLDSPYKTFFSEYFQTTSLSFRIIRSSEWPGLIFIPNPFSWSGQKKLLKCIFKEAINPPCLSNLDPYYDIPQDGLWSYLMQDYDTCHYPEKSYTLMKKHYEVEAKVSDEADVYTGEKVSINTSKKEYTLIDSQLNAMSIIRKLRWVTLGYQYDWTSKEYIWESSLIPFPEVLQQICRIISNYFIGWKEPYEPEAGIINYYQLRDSLTGHVDRSEKNDRAPLISISFGLDAIFLMGGATRDDPVLPFRLHSGDIVIMSEGCRRNYHGVPRILENSNPLELQTHYDLSTTENMDTLEHGLVSSLIKDARINLNVRQVF